MRGGDIAGIDTCWFNPNHKTNNLGVKVTYEIDSFDKLNEVII